MCSKGLNGEFRIQNPRNASYFYYFYRLRNCTVQSGYYDASELQGSTGATLLRGTAVWVPALVFSSFISRVARTNRAARFRSQDRFATSYLCRIARLLRRGDYAENLPEAILQQRCAAGAGRPRRIDHQPLSTTITRLLAKQRHALESVVCVTRLAWPASEEYTNQNM